MSGPTPAPGRTETPHPPKILILEDEPTDAELMQRALRKAGLDFTSRRVDTRAGFIEALDKFAPDVVLADYKLPDFTGADALGHVRQVHPEIPVVMVTGALGDEAAIELLHAGAKDYVLKGNLVRLPSAVQHAISTEQGIRARKAAERAVCQSEEKFRTLAEAAPDAILITDGSGTLNYWNPAATRMFGYAAAEMVGRKFDRWLLPERYQAAHEAGLARFKHTGRGPMIGRIVELAARRKDGVEIPVELSLSALQVGEEWHAIGILRDITERKATAAAVSKSHAMLQAAERIGHIGAWEWDAVRDVLVWSDETYRIYGRDPDHWTPTVANFISSVHPDDRQRVADAVASSIARRAPLDEVFRIVRPDGTERINHTLGEPTLDQNGELVSASGTTQDITERERADEGLRTSEERFRLLVENAPDAILLYDADRDRFVAANKAAEQLFGCSRDEILQVGSQHFHTSGQLDGHAFAEDDERALAGEATTSERRVRNGLGQERLCQVTLVRLPSPGRRLLRASFTDITERREAERALHRLNRTLRTLSRGNEALVHADSEADLLKEMCRVIVEVGGYRMAWVGLAQQDAAKSVTPVAWAGEIGQYLEQARITWADEPRGRGSHGRAIRSGEPQVTQNIGVDPRMTPWQQAAKESGFGSSVALPLKDATGVFAALMIYSAETNAFDTDELNLLRELAEDLAFGIRSLRESTAREALDKRWRAGLESTVGAIASTVEMRDPYTAGHQQRVARLAVAIARELALPEQQIEGLYLAGIVHDVGKIDIPAEILNKPGKISKLQYQILQGHAEAGYDILKGVDFPWPIAQMVRQHHERLDGSGYPQGLKGEAILAEAKILAVADVIEAMMSHRPYRPALGIEAALAEMQNGKGRLYDPAAVDACLALFRRKAFDFG